MKKILAFIGSALVAAGCFLPVIKAPDRTFNFFHPLPVPVPGVPENAMMYAGILLMLIAALSLVLALLNKTKFIWLSGIIVGAVLTGVYFGFHAKLDEMKAQADKQVGDLFGGMFKGITDSLFQAVELGGAGWYVIGSGAALLIVSSFINSPKEEIPSPKFQAPNSKEYKQPGP